MTPVALAMARLAVGDQEGALDALDELVATRQNRVGVERMLSGLPHSDDFESGDCSGGWRVPGVSP